MGNLQCGGREGNFGCSCSIGCKPCGTLQCSAGHESMCKKERLFDLRVEQDVFNQQDWPHIDYQNIIETGSQVIMQNQKDVANGVSLETVRIRRRMKKTLEYTNCISNPKPQKKADKNGKLDTSIDENGIVTTSPSTNNMEDMTAATEVETEVQYKQNSDKPNIEDEHKAYMTSQDMTVNLFMIMQEDITIMKAFVQRFYKLQIAEAGKLRQKQYDDKVFERSKDLWTVQMRRNRFLKKNQGAKGEKLKKIEKELQTMQEDIDDRAELKLDTRIISEQHTRYLEFEKQRYDQFLGEITLMIDDEAYQNAVEQCVSQVMEDD